MVLNISYCPPNISIWNVWVNHGTSQCFMDTITSSVIAGFILIAGTIQLWMYKKYGTEVSPYHLSRSKLYHLQVFLTIFLPVLEIIRFSLQGTLYEEKNIYGYMVCIKMEGLFYTETPSGNFSPFTTRRTDQASSDRVDRGTYIWDDLVPEIVSLVLTAIAYPYSLWIIKVERHFLLPSVPTRGHGIVLLMFWTLAFIAENLAFLNLGQNNWWFKLESATDQIEMALFVLRYITCLLIFLLGLKAPGIIQNIDYFSLNDPQRVPGTQKIQNAVITNQRGYLFNENKQI